MFTVTSFRSQSGFSTILAILLTGFLIVLSAGVLFLFLSESKINRTLFTSTAAYHAAEGSMEYALLKIKNHREGFSDSIDFGTDDAKILKASFRAPEMRYSLRTNKTGSTVHNASIEAKGFEIIPLFYEEGSTLNGNFKDPRTPSSGAFNAYRQSENIQLSLTEVPLDSVVWNVIANDDAGNTYGLAGAFSGSNTLLDSTTVWSIKVHNGSELTAHTETLAEFLSATRFPKLTEPYLVIFNTSESRPVDYELKADVGFSLPNTAIVASGKIGDITSNIRLFENKTRLFDALKYSVFVPQ